MMTMNRGEYIKRPMTGDNSKPKILVLNSPINIVRSLAETVENDFQLLFAGDREQLLELIHENTDASVVLVCESEPNSDLEDILRLIKNALPNSAKAVLSTNLPLDKKANFIKSDLANQVLPSDIPMEDLGLRLHELTQVHRLKWQVSEIEKIAITDPVTGLPNSRFFQSSLEVMIDKSLPDKNSFGLILVDIDQFRSFNEAFGYGEGDKILAAIGERMRKILPENLNIFRLGSDEFAIIREGLTASQAHEIGESIRQGFERYPFQGPNRRPAYVTVSVGMTTFPDHGIQYSDIITSAKAALHQAKRRGRNQTVVAQVC